MEIEKCTIWSSNGQVFSGEDALAIAPAEKKRECNKELVVIELRFSDFENHFLSGWIQNGTNA